MVELGRGVRRAGGRGGGAGDGRRGRQAGRRSRKPRGAGRCRPPGTMAAAASCQAGRAGWRALYLDGQPEAEARRDDCLTGGLGAVRCCGYGALARGGGRPQLIIQQAG